MDRRIFFAGAAVGAMAATRVAAELPRVPPRRMTKHVRNPGPKKRVAGLKGATSTDNAIVAATILKVMHESGAELTVLARHKQILPDSFSEALTGRCIDVHHSFLPSFKGAKPYQQARAGVKIIGATAHFVTADLDEGPIAEQDVRRVSHRTTTDEMVSIGRDIEASALSRAVRWYAEHRIFRNGNKTVVLCTGA